MAKESAGRGYINIIVPKSTSGTGNKKGGIYTAFW